MRRLLRPGGLLRHDDEGSALLITMMVLAVITSLTTVILAVSVNNLGSARRSQESAGALDAADAGITQAITYLRENGGRKLTCSPTCATNAWGNKNAPQQVDLPGATDQSYRVWIEPVPATAPAFYRVHSRGRDRDGVRLLQVDVELVPPHLPLGVFARSLQGGGSASMTRASVYTTGCVWNRSKIDFGGSTDAATGLPSAVHSSKIITNSNGNTVNCSRDNKAIHNSGVCNASYPFDHDSLGGSATPCSTQHVALGTAKYNRYYRPRDLDGNGTIDVNGTFLRDDAALRDVFNIDDENPLSEVQLDQLRSVAQSQGTYFTSASGFTSPTAANPDAVMFFDLAATDPGGIVDLNDITGYGRAKGLSATHPSCVAKSLLIIVDGGNVRLNSNQQLTASVVLTSKAPYGEVIKANGTADFIGTIFADKVNLVGNIDVSLDQCYLSNLSPHPNTVSVSNYLEVDR